MGARDDNGPVIAMAIRGPIARDDLRGLCDRVCRVLCERRPCIVRCDVHGVEPDAVTVDALARLQLAAKRHGCRLHVIGAGDALRRLIALMGLDDVLPV